MPAAHLVREPPALQGYLVWTTGTRLQLCQRVLRDTLKAPLGFLLMGLVANPFDWFVMLPIIVSAVGQAGCFVTPSILAVDVTPPDIRGSLLGAFNIVGGLGQVFFIQIGGILFDTMGPASPFLFVGLANLVVMAYAISVMNSPKERRAGENGA